MMRAFFVFSLLLAASPAVAQECDQKKATDAISVLAGLGNLTVMSADGSGLRMQVEHDWWLSRPPDVQRWIGNEINCAFAGPGKQVNSIVFISSRTGQPISAFRNRSIVAP